MAKHLMGRGLGSVLSLQEQIQLRLGTMPPLGAHITACMQQRQRAGFFLSVMVTAL